MWFPFIKSPSSTESSSLAPKNCLAILGTWLILSGQPFKVSRYTVLKMGSLSIEPLMMLFLSVVKVTCCMF